MNLLQPGELLTEAVCRNRKPSHVSVALTQQITSPRYIYMAQRCTAEMPMLAQNEQQQCKILSWFLFPFKYVDTLRSSDKYSMELVTHQMPPVLGLQGSDLACMLQLSSELNLVGKKKIYTYIYVCLSLLET